MTFNELGNRAITDTLVLVVFGIQRCGGLFAFCFVASAVLLFIEVV